LAYARENRPADGNPRFPLVQFLLPARARRFKVRAAASSVSAIATGVLPWRVARVGHTMRKPGNSACLRGLRGLAIFAVCVAQAVAAHAQDAMWLLNADGTYNKGTNWSTGTVPTGTAIFGASNHTLIAMPFAVTTIGAFQFNAGAPAYTFDLNHAILAFNGLGIVNNSSNAPSFPQFHGGLAFIGNSTAGNAIITGSETFTGFSDNSRAGTAQIGVDELAFSGNATADHATIRSGNVSFDNASSAGNATITSPSLLFFTKASSAGNANITTNRSEIIFSGTSTAENATINTLCGPASFCGSVLFGGNSTGGQARFITGAGATVDFSLTTGPAGDRKISAGSIEGAGGYRLGSNQLTVGGNNLAAVLSGRISDGGLVNNAGGSIVKVGTGTLTLTGTAAYSGDTTINGGTLLVSSPGSITVSKTFVNSGGKLSGNGAVGAVTVNAGGTFVPGSPGTSMTVSGNLTLQTGANYQVQIDPASATSANVTGTATLAGNVLAAFAPGSYLSRQYTILHSGGLSGRFDTLATTDLPAGFTAVLGYTGTDALLKLTADLAALNGAFNLNQQNVATAINGFFNAGGALPPNFVSLFGLSGGNLAGALSQLSAARPRRTASRARSSS
jgi:autotransporter-associated beta strand protein